MFVWWVYLLLRLWFYEQSYRSFAQSGAAALRGPPSVSGSPGQMACYLHHPGGFYPLVETCAHVLRVAQMSDLCNLTERLFSTPLHSENIWAHVI
jgi:hypothetical protein